MSKKKQKVILADEIADLIAPRRLLDPEIDDEDETRAKAIDYELDEEIDDLAATGGLSDFRKKNVKLLQDVDAKYRGKVSSRKELESDEESEQGEDGDEEDDEEDDNDFIEAFSQKLQNKGGSNGHAGSDEEDEDDEDDEDEERDFDSDADEGDFEDIENEDESAADEEDVEDEKDGEDDDESDFDGGDIVLKGSEQEKADAASILPKKQTEDQLQKGLCIQNELQIWEKLLEMRIHSQKLLIKMNSLPNYEKFHALAEHSDEFKGLAEESANNVVDLLKKMRSLQTHLLRQYPETKEIAAKRKSDTSGDSIDAKREKLADHIAEDFRNFAEYRNGVITKWHDRTKVLTPGSIKTQKLHGNVDILRKIEGVLAHKDDLVRKSQLLKGGYSLFDSKAENGDEPANEAEVYSEEVYDDTDFYHTQLRELIEFKTNTSTSPNEMAKQFLELQKLRKKMKKKVDTRASKGRKIRYVVHNKLVSFAAPHDPGQWTEESKTELYKSLFGQQV